MAVTLEDVEHVPPRRLSFTEEGEGRLYGRAQRDLRYMEQLNNLDTSTVEPLSHVIDSRMSSVRSGTAEHAAGGDTEERSCHTEKSQGPKVLGER